MDTTDDEGTGTARKTPLAVWIGSVHPAHEDAGEAAWLVRDAETNGRWLHGDAADVYALGAALFHEPPPGAGRLLGLEALRLASAAFEHDIVPVGACEPDDTDAAARRVRDAVVALDHTDPVDDDHDMLIHRAAARAVAQSALPAGALPAGVVELLRAENPSWLSDYAREQIALACAGVVPGRRWRYVAGLGVVTWRLTGVGTPGPASRT